VAESRAATQDQLEELHRLVAERLLEYLTTVPVSEMSAQWLECARKFLAQNGIQANLGEIRDVRKSLAELATLSMPFPTKQ
jgi:hypothetical protein